MCANIISPSAWPPIECLNWRNRFGPGRKLPSIVILRRSLTTSISLFGALSLMAAIVKCSLAWHALSFAGFYRASLRY